MSGIKTTSIRTGTHARNLQNYIDGKDALLRDSQNIIIESDWFNEMDDMREAFGHNSPSRSGATNVIMHHQVIAFLPDDADMNGGKMTPEKCMEYAKEYAARYYPDQQIAFALHKERSEADGACRYAVHMAINRTNIETGRRLHEGTGKQSKFTHIRQAREMDEAWGLKPLERGRNSKVHAPQFERWGTEGKITQQGKYSYKANTRDLCLEAARRATGIDAFRKRLDEWGVRTEVRNGRVYATDRDEDKYTFRADRLHPSLAMPQLQKTFERNAEAAQAKGLAADIARDQQAATRYAQEKEAYLQKVADTSERYSQTAQAAKGTDYEEFPQIKLPRPSDALRKDPDVQGVVLSALHKGDRLRDRLAANVPVKQNIEDASLSRQHGQGQRGQARQESHHRRTEQDHKQDKGRPHRR